MTPENIFGCSYLGGFALLMIIGMRLSQTFRRHMQIHHPAEWEGMVSLKCPASSSLQAVMEGRNERRRAIKIFLNRKDYLTLNDPQLVEICQRMKILNVIGVVFFVLGLIGWILMMNSRNQGR